MVTAQKKSTVSVCDNNQEIIGCLTVCGVAHKPSIQLVCEIIVCVSTSINMTVM